MGRWAWIRAEMLDFQSEKRLMEIAGPSRVIDGAVSVWQYGVRDMKMGSSFSYSL